MWAYIFRKLLYNVPVYFGALLLVFLALRVQDPVYAYLGPEATGEEVERLRQDMGLDKPVVVQFGVYLSNVLTFDFDIPSWNQKGYTVGEILSRSWIPSLSITVPQIALSTVIGVLIALLSAYFRGRFIDRFLVIAAVIGMSISFLVFIVFGQFFLAALPQEEGWEFAPFAVQGYEHWIGVGGEEGWFLRPSVWAHYCLLPVLIGVVVSMGYDTRFYRAVMVEETGRDYITTATAKGATKPKIMFVHMLKNAMIPVVTRVMSTLPFVVVGSILLEMYFSIPGMGREIITAINARDFPVIQYFVAVFALIFIISVILTDVLYAVFDPRVRLS
ncbi:MAG: peptide ABC transporter permease [Phycisphaerae bacterium]|nr:peptide ABC transporter permease [Phycisphaerae bacterium]|tara:strand:+ start:104 stop:1096 length:993 start_codon:yes stop_codon:yes gene_type:complete